MAHTANTGSTEVGPRPGHGVRRRLTDPADRQFLLQAARSGHLDWSVYIAQGLVGLVVQTLGATLVNRVVFRGGWTVIAWQGDAIAPKRTRVVKTRYATEEEAVAALDELAAEIERGSERFS